MKIAVGVVFGATMVFAPSAVMAQSCGGLADPQDRMLFVKREESRCGWPFKVDMIGILCVPNAFRGGAAVFALSRAKAYPLNGIAKDARASAGYPIGPITDIAENEFRTTPWIKPGLELCRAP